jgi:proteasome lid subunit RPN8/RPN11
MADRPFCRLIVDADVLAAVIEQARSEAPLECCGLLAGRVASAAGVVEVRYPLVNEAASPVEFVSAARGMFDAVRDIDQRGLTVLAVYHSHPASPPVPSKTDLERNYSPDVVNIIISLQTEPPEVKGWWLRDAEFEPALLEVRETRLGGVPTALGGHA